MTPGSTTSTTVAPPSPPQQQQLTAEELQTVLDWNYSESALPPHRAPLPDETVGHIFEQLARRAPSRLALVAEDDTQMTYSQVLDKANAMSKCLLMNAAKNEETGNLLPACVLVALQRTAALPIALLATVRSGLAYWGVDMVLQSAPVVQKNMKALNVRTMIVDSDTFALLFPDGTSPPPPELSVLMVSASGDVVYYRSSLAAVASSAYLCPMRTMYIEFTSGSTGQPKAVAVPHKACISYLRNSGTIYRWGTETRSLLYHSVSFDLHVHDLWGPWSHGGCVIVVNVPIADANGVWERGRDTQATHLSMTPFGFKLFTTVHLRRQGRLPPLPKDDGGPSSPASVLKRQQSEQANQSAYDQLESVMLCGEALDMANITPWLMEEIDEDGVVMVGNSNKVDGGSSFATRIIGGSPSRRITTTQGGPPPGSVYIPKLSYPSIVNCYGITETTVINTFLEVTPERLSWPSSIGRRLPHTVMLLLDPVTKAIVPHGGTGEIYLTGDCLASGYITSTEKNDSAFVPVPQHLHGVLRSINPAMAAAGSLKVMYKTGDVARFEHAYNGFVFGGRTDSEIKSGGFRVNPNEVEEILNKMTEVVKQAVVVASLHPDGRKVMFACIVPTTSSATTVTKGGIRTLLREVVAEYKVPQIYLLPVGYVFPVTASNKVDRVALATWGTEVLKLPPNTEPTRLP